MKLKYTHIKYCMDATIDDKRMTQHGWIVEKMQYSSALSESQIKAEETRLRKYHGVKVKLIPGRRGQLEMFPEFAFYKVDGLNFNNARKPSGYGIHNRGRNMNAFTSIQRKEQQEIYAKQCREQAATAWTVTATTDTIGEWYVSSASDVTF